MQIRTISKANVYVNGNSFLGKAQQIELPEINFNKVEQGGLGLIGTPEFASHLEAMEAKITWLSFEPEAMALFDPYAAQEIQARGFQEIHDGSGRTGEVAVVAFLTCRNFGLTMGTMQQGEATRPESTFAVDAYKLTMDGTDELEIDIFNNIHKVKGADVRAREREILGG